MAERGAQRGRKGDFPLPNPTPSARRTGPRTDFEAARWRAFPGFLSGATCLRGCAETHSPPIRPHYGVFAELRPESATFPFCAYMRREFCPSQDRNPTIRLELSPWNRARRTRRGIGALRTFRTIDLSAEGRNASEGLYEGSMAILIKCLQPEHVW